MWLAVVVGLVAALATCHAGIEILNYNPVANPSAGSLSEFLLCVLRRFLKMSFPISY